MKKKEFDLKDWLGTIGLEKNVHFGTVFTRELVVVGRNTVEESSTPNLLELILNIVIYDFYLF